MGAKGPRQKAEHARLSSPPRAPLVPKRKLNAEAPPCLTQFATTTESWNEDVVPAAVPVIITTCEPAGGSFTELPLLQPEEAAATTASIVMRNTPFPQVRLRLANPIIPNGSNTASHVSSLGASGRSRKLLALVDTVIIAAACPTTPPLTVTVVGAIEHVM